MRGPAVPTIRPALDDDGPAVAALIAAVFAEYEGCPFVAAEFPELRAPATHYRRLGGDLWVAEDDGAIVGTVALRQAEPGVFELSKVYVARPYRGTGLAHRLYALAEGEALARGGRRLRLWTDTRFASGHRFYEKLGFERLPVTRYLADATRAWEFAYHREFPA
jgi:putative acetyltransferase